MNVRTQAMVASKKPMEAKISARFEYARMSAKDFRDALAKIDLPAPAFARIFGVRIEVVTRWLKGDQDIPPWAFVSLWIMREVPKGTAIARTAAANHIVRDRNFPERGEFPYLTIPDDEEEDS